MSFSEGKKYGWIAYVEWRVMVLGWSSAVEVENLWFVALGERGKLGLSPFVSLASIPDSMV